MMTVIGTPSSHSMIGMVSLLIIKLAIEKLSSRYAKCAKRLRNIQPGRWAAPPADNQDAAPPRPHACANRASLTLPRQEACHAGRTE